MTGPFLSYLPTALIEAAYKAGKGNEIDSGKLDSPESSAQLVANTFGLFIDRAVDLPALPGQPAFGWPARSVMPEQCCRFPWSGGTHPWLDVLIETDTHLVGIESKRFEPYRGAKTNGFSDAYDRKVWGDSMVPFERERDAIKNGQHVYAYLDAVQLVKHAFGLRTEAMKRSRKPVLLYAHAEPRKWPDGKSIAEVEHVSHKKEIALFAERVKSAEVKFGSFTYRELIASFGQSPIASVRDHAIQLAARYQF